MASAPVEETLGYSFFVLTCDLDTVFAHESGFQESLFMRSLSHSDSEANNDPEWRTRCQNRLKLSESVGRHAQRIAAYGQEKGRDVVPLVHLMRILQTFLPSQEWNGSFETAVRDAFDLIYLDYIREHPQDQVLTDPDAIDEVPAKYRDRGLALPREVKHWSLTTLREKLIKIGAKVTRHSKYVTFQLAEVAVTRRLFAAILNRIERLALPPPVVDGNAV